MSKSLIELISKAWNNNILFSLVLELTNACDLRCVFCYTDHDQRGKRLSLEQFYSLLDAGRKLGTIYLTLTGGEPTLHKNFFSIGSYAAEKGYCLRIKTHAAYSDSRIIQRIKQEIDPLWIDISLHGADEETYEATTGVKGSFKRFLRNLAEFASLDCRIQLLSPLTTINYHQVGKMVDLANSLGLPLRFDPQITPRNNGDKSTNIYSLDEENLAEYYRYVNTTLYPEFDFADPESLDLNRDSIESRYCCGAGAGSLTIDPFGNVFPCVAWRTSLGSIRNQSLDEIWLTSQTLNLVREKNEIAENFRKINLDKIGTVLFCPGRAIQEEGKPDILYSDVVVHNRVQKKIKKNKKNA